MNSTLRFTCCMLLICFGFTTGIILHAQQVVVLDSNAFTRGPEIMLSKTSFRGLSVANDQVIWVSGNRGTIARSTNGGASFEITQIKGYEKSDFRDIEAFDENRALIMSSGTPALILKTTDGGETWKEVFRRKDTAYFLDAMDFWDETNGVVVGDPINDRFVILQTADGGDTWQKSEPANSPVAEEVESVFAASGTSLRCWGRKEFGFVTGGESSRFVYTKNRGDSYSYIVSGLSQNKESAGAFSFAPYGEGKFVITGGDYKTDTATAQTVSGFSTNGEAGHFYLANGYRSCVERISEKTRFIACGTSGVDMGQYKWEKISGEGFHVVRKAKKGKAVFLAGPKGKIGKLVY